MIFIVIDHSEFAHANVLGVFREHAQCQDFLLSIEAEEMDDIDVVCWDIVKNKEVA